MPALTNMPAFATLPPEIQVLVCKQCFDNISFTELKTNIGYGGYGNAKGPSPEVLGARKLFRISSAFEEGYRKPITRRRKFDYHISSEKEVRGLQDHCKPGVLPPHGRNDEQASVCFDDGCVILMEVSFEHVWNENLEHFIESHKHVESEQLMCLEPGGKRIYVVDEA